MCRNQDAARLEKELTLLGEEDWKPGQIDHLAVGLDLGKVGIDRQVAGECGRHSKLRVDPGLYGGAPSAEGCPRRIVVIRRRSSQGIRKEVEPPATGRVAELDQFSLSRELEEAFGSSVRAPEHLLVLAPDETLDIEAQGAAPSEPKRPERDAELGGPPRPDAIPALVHVLEPVELAVPHGAVGVGAEEEGAPPVMKAVHEQRDVVVHCEIGVPSELAGPNASRRIVVGAHTDEESGLSA